MSRDEKNKLGFTIGLISEFAIRFKILPKQAYAYLKRFKGMEHLEAHYGFLHTQSYDDNVDIMAQVCANNGGKLK